MAQVGSCSLSGTLCTLCWLAAYRTSQILSQRVWALLSKFVMFWAAIHTQKSLWTQMDRERLAAA